MKRFSAVRREPNTEGLGSPPPGCSIRPVPGVHSHPCSIAVRTPCVRAGIRVGVLAMLWWRRRLSVSEAVQRGWRSRGLNGRLQCLRAS